ncbi:hypothetical protein LTR37_005502 [Vermiconidia calcicola]|uniref:Uncharacterized protein n=1 Tax=Vermiconidia calcicola TaxID=1690605 RepID=A0ACC3NIS1_9PEZI|nr:hypothetical protein LTR37_005502 [Vermiconidia calcicola]
MNKPNTLPLNEWVFERSTVIGQVTEVQSDVLMPTLIRYQRILEEVHVVYQIDKTNNAYSRIHMHAKRLAAALEDWRLSVPGGFWNAGLFVNRYHAAQVRIYEMGLLYHFQVDRRCSTVPEAAAGQPYSRANLVSCVDAIKRYLDCFLALDPTLHIQLPYDEWSRLVVALFVLYKLSVGPKELPGWEVSICRSTIDLEAYLSDVVGRLQHGNQPEDPPDVASGGLYHLLPAILESAKASFVAARDTPHLVTPGLECILI